MNDRDDRDMVKIRARARGRLTFAQNYKYFSSILKLCKTEGMTDKDRYIQ